MPKAFRWRALVVAGVLIGAVAVLFARPARLGLDLRGGTQIVLEARGGDGRDMSRTLEVLRRRVDALGVAEPSLQRSGEQRFIVELPGVDDPEAALAVIGRTAQLAFHPVVGTGGEELRDERGGPLHVASARVTGDAVRTAKATLGGAFGGAWQVEVEFRGDGSREWASVTGAAACAPAADPARRIAIVLDREVISSPAVSDGVPCGTGISGGNTVITGQFTEREAKHLALLIRAGALPVPVDVVEQRTVGPTLGEAAVRASVLATLIGASLTILFLVVYYRLLGVLAGVALVAYAVISLAVLVGLQATLTLPGIAGFVLAIGMAVDANVLVFERAKDEYAGGRSARVSLRSGFRDAWSAIADSNATTLIAALILFFFAAGGVRGFGVTLGVGVLVSMFTALVVTRVLVELVARLNASPGLLGLEGGRRLRDWLAERGPDLMGRSRLWCTLSVVALTLAVAGIALRGLSYGVEFSGGALVEYRTERSVDLDRLRTELAAAGQPRAVVQASGDGNVTVRAGRLSTDERRAVDAAVDRLGGSADEVRAEFVGPTIGDELRRKAVVALALALAAQLVYLAVRFRWTFGAAAVAAMFHDVVILLGVFAWLGKEMDAVFLAALLTVIGYSINDSVVVFDRIREQRRKRTREPLARVANDACLQTIPRTVNTGLGALFILAALYALGGQTLTDFALALIVGILVGTYSSVFTAAPLAVAIEGRTTSATAPLVRSRA